MRIMLQIMGNDSQQGLQSRTRLAIALLVLLQLSATCAQLLSGPPLDSSRVRLGNYDASRPANRGPPEKRATKIPLRITNSCSTTLWPGISTQHGTGPGTGGFELKPHMTEELSVGATWQGRVWGRSNCSFNDDGSGPSNLNGVNGNGAACTTGDCFGKLDCEGSGAVPCTLAEFNLAGGVTGQQTFYDISLVDGYNLPVGLVYIPADNTTAIPPNLVNPTCIATEGWLWEPSRTGTVYTNASFPLPWEQYQTNAGVSRWCPWDLQAYPPSKPGDGVYPYPDDKIERPAWNPCKSMCAATNSPRDCCTGEYNDPDKCRPGLYSRNAKAVCPDAYSFAFDDQTSTFIIPQGGGWEVIFCPDGRSTDILATFGDQLSALASGGQVDEHDARHVLGNITYIETHNGAATVGRGTVPCGWLAVAVLGSVWLGL